MEILSKVIADYASMVPVYSFLNLSIVFAVLRINDAFLAFNFKKLKVSMQKHMPNAKVFILEINYALRTADCHFLRQQFHMKKNT